jgi:hypothetical protein
MRETVEFSYTHAAYGVTLIGLDYTLDQWQDMMLQVNGELAVIGNKSAHRDYAWSLVAMASYTATASDSGSLQFYSTGDAAVIFNRQIAQIGVAAGGKDRTGIYCNAKITTAYSAVDGTLKIETDLNTSYGITQWASDGNPFSEPYSSVTTEYTCPYYADNNQQLKCRNPCPGVLSPLGMGYQATTGDSKASAVRRSSKMAWTLNLRAVMTALAVNLGMMPLAVLNEVPDDAVRKQLFHGMVSQGYISPAIEAVTSSYFDAFYAPLPNIYCTSFKNAPPQCKSFDTRKKNARHRY